VRWNLGYLYAAVTLFMLAAIGTIRALEIGSRWLAMAAAVGMLAAAICFIFAAWLPRRTVDWDRIEAEQRLWESGPLGRRWLRVRRRLEKMWKL
jgi:hypothetical protein